MKVSLEWLSDFVTLPTGEAATEVARQLTLKTVEVENVIDTAAGLRQVVVGRVAAVEPVGERGHHAVTSDLGDGTETVVVSRAPNLIVGMAVAVALPGARLATGTGEATAEAREVTIAGHRSCGVLCTAGDLGLARLFPGAPGSVLDLSDLEPAPGTLLAELIGFNDTVLEIDNKSLTNRPDLWGHYGIARELAAIYGVPLRPLPSTERPESVEGLVGEVDPALCRRMAVLTFTLPGSGSAPLWLRSRLARVGEASVGLCVDISNYVMFTVGQPTHVYDRDRITLPLSVRGHEAAAGLELLTGQTVQVPAGAPVIDDATGPVGLAGVMGGAGSALRADSRRFALEAACFRPQPIRAVSQRVGLRTEASARFEKGLDTQRVDLGLDLFLHLLTQAVPGATVEGVQDLDVDPTQPVDIDVEFDYLATRIGTRLDPAEIHRTLRSLGFTTVDKETGLRVGVPTWRATGDVSGPHDIVEEVARIHGYDELPVAAITVALRPVRALAARSVDRVVRETLATRGGLQEVVTYPWVADAMLAAVGLGKQGAVRFDGAPAPDRDSLRPSLIPNLLEAVVANLRWYPTFGLFEVGTVFPPGPAAPYRGEFEPMPPQARTLAIVLVGRDGRVLFGQAKGLLEMLRRFAHLTDLQVTAGPTAAWADPSGRGAVTADGAAVGTVGLLTSRTKRLAGITADQVACVEVDLAGLALRPSRDNKFQPLPELPEADFDLSVVVADSAPWDTIAQAATGAHPLVHRVGFVDEFRGSWVPDGHRSLSLRVTLRPTGTTLDAQTIATARTAVLQALKEATGAYLRE
jgi:phenylalanyl-tRNA synthetase beta chain